MSTNKSKKENFRVVVAAIIHKNNKFLLGKRDSKDENQPGFWSIPAGHIEANEHGYDIFEDNLKREVKEEINVDIEIEKYIDSHVWVADDFKKITVVFLCKIASGEPMAGDETTDVRWFSYSEVEKLKLPPNVLRVITKATKIINT